MYIFHGNDGKLSPVDEVSFKLEKDIQTLCENNLMTLLNLQFVKSEFCVDAFRIDSLAFDEESKSFVIIEYKRDKNYSVIDQGVTYLSLLLNHKADFILEYKEQHSNNSLKRDDVDWSQSKVIFIAPSFTTYQKASINFKDLPIELWEIKQYKNNLISLNQINAKNTATASIKTIQNNNSEIKSLTKEIITYDEKYHTDGIPENIVELYEKLKEYILGFGDDVETKVKKVYIAFVVKSNFCSLQLQNKQIRCWINLRFDEINDPLKLARDVSNIGHHGTGDCELSFSDDKNLEYIVGLIKQGYNKAHE